MLGLKNCLNWVMYPWVHYSTYLCKYLKFSIIKGLKNTSHTGSLGPSVPIIVHAFLYEKQI